MNRIKEFFAKKYYWYQVKYTYREKLNGRIIFHWKETIGLVKRRTIIDHREVKQTIEMFDRKPFVRSLLCNGILSAEPICYLGKFSTNNKLYE